MNVRSAGPSGASTATVEGRAGNVKVLLVKLSSLGDVVHTLPVVQDILAALPGAQIDWVVEKSFAPLLTRVDGLRRIVPCQIRRWTKTPFAAGTRREWRTFKAELQQEHYDAVIDLQGLTKSALVARLARLAPGGKRFALANQTDGSGYEAPTRWVADVAVTVAPHTAAVPRSRELAAQALAYHFSGPPDFGLRGRATAAAGTSSKTVAFVHGTSRADKQWPAAHWVALGRQLIAAGYDIALAHGNPAELATSHELAAGLDSLRENGSKTVIWPLLPLDELVDQLGACAGVVGVDSGVSHIAVALDLPHVQIYNFDTAWRTGPDSPSGRQVSVYAEPTPGVDAVLAAWQRCAGEV